MHKTISKEEFARRRDAGEPTWENGVWKGAGVQSAQSAILHDVSWNGGEPFELDCQTLITQGIPQSVKGGAVQQPQAEQAPQAPESSAPVTPPAPEASSENQSQPPAADAGDPPPSGTEPAGDPEAGSSPAPAPGRSGIKLGKA